MEQQRIGKRKIARMHKAELRHSFSLVGLSVVLAGVGTVIFPGVGTLAGVAVARAIVRRAA
jgi:hypothetical protein